MYHEITEGRVRIHGPNGLFYETSKPLLTVSVTARRATDGYIFNVIEGPGSSVKSVRVLSRAEEPVTEQGSAGFGGHTLRIQTNALPVDLTLIVSTHDPLDIAAHTFPDDYPAEFGEYIHKIMRTLDTKHFNVQELLSR
jgi:hypothetical protein